MPEPTKADLKAAVAQLTKENTGLRDLLAAISECAGTVPVANRDEAAEWRRTSRVLANIKGFAALDDYPGYFDFAAGELRRIAAEPVGYEVYAGLRAEPITDSGRTCGQANPGSGAWCHRGGDHGVHEDTDGEKWRTDGGEAGTIDPEYPKPGSRIPPELNHGMDGYVVGDCGHRVAGSEWRAGFRTCENCGINGDFEDDGEPEPSVTA